MLRISPSCIVSITTKNKSSYNYCRPSAISNTFLSSSFTTDGMNNNTDVKTIAECEERNGTNGQDLWVVVDSYVLDLTLFVQHHPGSARKIINKTKQVGPVISNHFLDHFGHTVRAFREACQQYDKFKTPVNLTFPETGPDIPVVVIGKIQQET